MICEIIEVVYVIEKEKGIDGVMFIVVFEDVLFVVYKKILGVFCYVMVEFDDEGDFCVYLIEFLFDIEERLIEEVCECMIMEFEVFEVENGEYLYTFVNDEDFDVDWLEVLFE